MYHFPIELGHAEHWKPPLEKVDVFKAATRLKEKPAIATAYAELVKPVLMQRGHRGRATLCEETLNPSLREVVLSAGLVTFFGYGARLIRYGLREAKKQLNEGQFEAAVVDALIAARLRSDQAYPRKRNFLCSEADVTRFNQEQELRERRFHHVHNLHDLEYELIRSIVLDPKVSGVLYNWASIEPRVGQAVAELYFADLQAADAQKRIDGVTREIDEAKRRANYQLVRMFRGELQTLEDRIVSWPGGLHYDDATSSQYRDSLYKFLRTASSDDGECICTLPFTMRPIFRPWFSDCHEPRIMLALAKLNPELQTRYDRIKAEADKEIETSIKLREEESLLAKQQLSGVTKASNLFLPTLPMNVLEQYRTCISSTNHYPYLEFFLADNAKEK